MIRQPGTSGQRPARSNEVDALLPPLRSVTALLSYKIRAIDLSLTAILS